MVDPAQSARWGVLNKTPRFLTEVMETVPTRQSYNSCSRCLDITLQYHKRSKFEGYTGINLATSTGLTDHQYFLCDYSVNAFIFKTRTWGKFPLILFLESHLMELGLLVKVHPIRYPCSTASTRQTHNHRRLRLHLHK